MTDLPSLLVIDDAPQNIEVLGEYLSDGYDIQCALSGAEGLALIAKRLPDLILLDVMMPEMDGYAVCDAIRRNPATREIPIIFVTAKGDADSESRALAAGAVDFIHKPINRDVVRARVRLHLTLKARERELRALNDALEAKVTARTRALSDALTRAESAHRAKQRFLANVNHELRTPMNAILGLSSLLAVHYRDPTFQERTAKIREAAQQLLGMVDGIIVMADLQANRLSLQAADFALESIFGDLEKSWRKRASAKGLDLGFELDPQLPRCLNGDPVRLTQLLENLLGNAVKFSERGRIMVRAKSAETSAQHLMIRLEVEDQGIGIDSDRQADIFAAFEQADNSSTRRYGGAGLGLAICKQLTELMGGEIGFNSVLGQGSLFWALLPIGAGESPVSGPSAAGAGERAYNAETEEPDWYEIRQTVIAMSGLLLTDSVEALVVWERARPLLDFILGQDALPFQAAMDVFEFSEAQKYLEAARARHPELARRLPGGN